MVEHDEDGGFIQSNEDISTPKKLIIADEGVTLPVYENSCLYCGKIPLNDEFKQNFKINVCKKCSYEEVKLITKTTCTEKYLLDSNDLKTMNCISRKNPHGDNWHEMMLYMEDQIIELAEYKYGSLEEIDKIIEGRVKARKNRKIKKIKKNVKMLKKRTLHIEFKERHRHDFKFTDNKGTCECGMTIDAEDLE